MRNLRYDLLLAFLGGVFTMTIAGYLNWRRFMSNDG